MDTRYHTKKRKGIIYLKRLSEEVDLSARAVGWEWIVSFNWVGVGKIQKMWFGGQVERFIKKFGLTDDEAKQLKAEISVRGLSGLP